MCVCLLQLGHVVLITKGIAGFATYSRGINWQIDFTVSCK